MIGFCLSIVVFGAMLGMRFKVLILFPALALVSIAIMAAGAARHDNVADMLIAFVSASICLQIGYLGGIVTRCRLAALDVGDKSPLRTEPVRY